MAALPDQYILDADVFIAAARRYYAFDLVPGFWRELMAQAAAQHILSIDRVRTDLLRGKDQLADWATNSFAPYFVPTKHDDIVRAYRSVVTWAQSQPQFTGAAQAEFAAASDGWLVAYALAKNCVAVTNETFDLNIRRRIKIPNACQALGVRYVDTFGMLRALRVTV